MKVYRRPGFWVLIAVAAALAFFAIKRTYSSVAVKAEPVVRRDYQVTVTPTATGTIRADEEFKVSARRAGKIVKLGVEEGDRVRGGDLLAELDPDEVAISREIARASLRRARAALEEAVAAYGPLKAGVEADIRIARASLKEAEDRHRRYGELMGRGFISQSELDQAERDYEIAQATLQSALASRGRLDAKSGEIEARRAAVAEAEKSLALAELNYGYSFIRSPIDGIVASRPVKLGETVMTGALVAEVISTGSLYIEAFVDEADVANVNVGQEVEITMDAYPGRTFAGQVYLISPVVTGGKLETRTFEVRTRFKDLDAPVKTGMSADVEIIVDRVRDTLVVPSQAVIERGGRKYAYVMEDGRARLRPVEVGITGWTFTQISSGLEEGESLIVNPDVPGLKDGGRVKAEISGP
ncbi:MAG: efflux RND transporter periplasmic adaptor subunit [Thermodesulfovibrionales bacterium]